MDKGTFIFILALIGAAFAVMFIEWLYRKLEPRDETEKEKHRALMKEIRDHKND